MIRQLTTVSSEILKQLEAFVLQLKDEDYSMPLALLSENTLAKHIRHVLEMYEEMLTGVSSGLINYDARKRNLLIEHNRQYTLQYIMELTERIAALESDSALRLAVSYDTGGESVIVKTSLNRELSYNIEHAIHHMAILQITVKHLFPYMVLPEGFGVAFSTQTYLKQHVHTHLHTR
jgi:uncharacterized damage-inducible protein DinB